jgi:hypothetical protein
VVIDERGDCVVDTNGPPKTAGVVVTGMHRTGTSMIAKMLRLGGLWLGDDEDMIDAAPDNPEGFFEHAQLVRLNDELLEAVGGAWDHPPRVGPIAADDPRVARLAETAQGVIAELSRSEPWGWKDPRTSLTASFWLDLAPDLRFVICVRHPLEVALSLKRRNQISYSLGLGLWERYYASLLDAVPARQRLVTHYGSHLSGTGAELDRVLTFSGLSTERAPAARSGIDQQLRHHQIAISLKEAGVSAGTVDLYRRLCEAAGWEVEVDSMAPPSATVHRAVLDLEVTRDLVEKQRRHIEWLESQMVVLEETRSALRMAREQARKRDDQVELLERQVQALDADRENLGERLAAIDLAPTEASLATLEGRLESLELTVQDAVSRLDARSSADVAMVSACREVVRSHVPRDAPVLVVGKNDPALANLHGRSTGNFPQDRYGRYPGFALANGEAAIAHLEALRAKGNRFLLVPSSSRWWLDTYPAFGEHVLNRYPVIASDSRFGLLADLTVRRAPADGWPLAISESIGRLARVTGGSLTVLDWTDLEMASQLPNHNVFSAPDSDGQLPYLDGTIDVVLITNRERISEARRVGTVAIVTLRHRDGGHPEVASVESVEIHDPTLEAPMAVVPTRESPNQQWLARLTESLGEEPASALMTGPQADTGEAEVVALVDEGVLPLPGCFLAARKVLRSAKGAGGIAVKLLTAEGALEAAGVAVFEDGSHAGIAEGSFDTAAPWHEYVRETCWGPGLMLFKASVLGDISRDAPDGDLHAVWSARLWAKGSRILYQPAAAAVRALPATATSDVDLVREAWAASHVQRCTRPAELDEAAWRDLLVAEDLHGSRR